MFLSRRALLARLLAESQAKDYRETRAENRSMRTRVSSLLYTPNRNENASSQVAARKRTIRSARFANLGNSFTSEVRSCRFCRRNRNRLLLGALTSETVHSARLFLPAV